VEGGKMMKTLDAARAYLAKLPPAISGAGGHDATFRAACWLIRFGLGDMEAMALLREWNGNHCQPPWKEKELAHKLRDARRVAGGERRAFTPSPAVRVAWKIERKTPKPTTLIQPVTAPAPAAEVLPYITPSGNLVIPFSSPAHFHWWKNGGITPTETRRLLRFESRQ
jgi:hypothetical protein